MINTRFETGTQNVFEDLGLQNAEEHLVKAQLVYRIDMILKEQKLRQVNAGQLFGIPQTDVSKMLRAQFCEFAIERLLWFRVALNQDVKIVRSRRGERDATTLRVLSRRAALSPPLRPDLSARG
jgi:predicted XRE-type DNA-binding protein